MSGVSYKLESQSRIDMFMTANLIFLKKKLRIINETMVIYIF